jgi:hypothetical protein
MKMGKEMGKKNNVMRDNSFTELMIYSSPSGKVKVEVLLRNENIWLTQDKIAELFGVQRPAITKHLKNIFQAQELKEDSVSSILEHTAGDGKNYSTKFYNKVTHELAVELAEKEFEKFKKEEDHHYKSDFDNHLNLLMEERAKYGK